MIKVIYFSSFVCSVDFADPYDSEVKYMELEVQGPNFKLTLSFAASGRSGHVIYANNQNSTDIPVIGVEGGEIGDSSSWI